MRGVLVEKVTKDLLIDGSFSAAVARPWATFSSWVYPTLFLSSTISLKPPAVPMPRTGGGVITRMVASSTPASRLVRSATMALWSRPCLSRDLKSSRMT